MGAHCWYKDPTARAKDKEQRPSHSDSDSVVSHKGRAGHKDRVAAATRSLWPARPLGSPRVLATTGPNFKVLLMELGCNRVQPSSISSTLKKWEYGYHGSWYLVLRVLEARDFASARLLHLRPLGHPEAPRGDFDQIGSVVRLLARFQGAPCSPASRRTTVPDIWSKSPCGAWGCPRCTNTASCTAREPLHLRQRQNRLGFSSWLKVWATARITRRPGCSWTERRSESWAWVRQPTRSKSWAFPSS